MKNTNRSLTDKQRNTPEFQVLYNTTHCHYCQQKFGEFAEYRGDSILLTQVIDHFIPYIVCNETEFNNLVSCCQICNRIKRNHNFDNLDKAREYILPRWKEAINSYFYKKSKKLKLPELLPLSNDDSIYEKYSTHEILEIYGLKW